MFLLKSKIVLDDITELFEIREKLKPLEKKEKSLSKQIKNRIKNSLDLCEISKNNEYIAEMIKKSSSEICPSDLHKKVTINDFFILVKVKIKEVKEFLSKKDLEEIAVTKSIYSLSIKKIEKG